MIMKAKYMIWISVLCLIVAGCSKERESEPPTPVPTPVPPTSRDSISTVLFDKTWKLEGIGRVANGVVREPVPKGYGRCYTLTFRRDSFLTGFTSLYEMAGSFQVLGNRIEAEGVRQIYSDAVELFDDRIFLDGIRRNTHFEVDANQLKIYFEEGREYLLFRVWREGENGDLSPGKKPDELVKMWRLTGFVCVSDGSTTTVDSKSCGSCYTLTFRGDGTLSGRTSANTFDAICGEKSHRMQISDLIGPNKGERADDQRYREALLGTVRWEIARGQLRIYYDAGRYFMRFEAPPQLTGSRWIPVGIVNSATGVVRSLAPEGGYWIRFTSPTKGNGHSVFNRTHIDLEHPPFISRVTEVGDSHNGDAALFYSIIKRLESYTWKGDELKFFFDNNRQYLLYKRSVPDQLTGSRWCLVGTVNVQTGALLPIAPADSYQLNFTSETDARGRAVENALRVDLIVPPYFHVETKANSEKIGDAAMFYSIIRSIEYYNWVGGELKFYYNNSRDYLLYTYLKS